jgi:DNA polymerase sigma
MFHFSEGYPEKQEEETLEKWRERCREKEKSVVLNAGKLLRDSNQENFANVNIVLEARVPTIKFVHKKTGIKCDLSFKVR